MLLAGQGGTVPARDWFDEAVGLYQGMEARWAIRSAAARVRDYGIRLRQDDYLARSAHGWESLTPTEAKIARLIADGRSNPEIAAGLSLSRDTVRAHVSHILAKFGARSRTEIVASAAREAGPAGTPVPAEAPSSRPGRLVLRARVAGGTRRGGRTRRGGDHAADSRPLGRRQPLAEEGQADQRRHRGLDRHPDAEQAGRDAAQRLKLQPVGDDRRQQADARARREERRAEHRRRTRGHARAR